MDGFEFGCGCQSAGSQQLFEVWHLTVPVLQLRRIKKAAQDVEGIGVWLGFESRPFRCSAHVFTFAVGVVLKGLVSWLVALPTLRSLGSGLLCSHSPALSAPQWTSRLCVSCTQSL